MEYLWLPELQDSSVYFNFFLLRYNSLPVAVYIRYLRKVMQFKCKIYP